MLIKFDENIKKEEKLNDRQRRYYYEPHFQFEVRSWLDHPPNSPDLAPSDYDLFPKL